MRSTLIAAGGALLTAAALFGTAGAAAADQWYDEAWNNSYPSHCGLGVNEDSTYQHVTKHGVFAGTRAADGCKGGKYDDHGADDRYDDDNGNEGAER
ncbi:hypothetical protein AB0I81_37055 [Nonomuraea sp. NPDC050404]|uniref:hypothetical protein n=1 Tax=Nonomuraea sp. NPDC050404 TaxID=3155783 RepID=UPI0033F50326